jgi:hypothetical protein
LDLGEGRSHEDLDGADPGAGRRIRAQLFRDYLDDAGSAPPADVDRDHAQLARPRKRDHGIEPPELAAARKQVGELARRLRGARALTDDKRRKLLADLTDRLTALIGVLVAQNVPSSAVSELTALVAAIEAGGPVGPMWDASLHALDDFAGRSAAPNTKRRAFWKRG